MGELWKDKVEVGGGREEKGVMVVEERERSRSGAGKESWKGGREKMEEGFWQGHVGGRGN